VCGLDSVGSGPFSYVEDEDFLSTGETVSLLVRILLYRININDLKKWEVTFSPYTATWTTLYINAHPGSVTNILSFSPEVIYLFPLWISEGSR
jgi:hypothetical protein